MSKFTFLLAPVLIAAFSGIGIGQHARLEVTAPKAGVYSVPVSSADVLTTVDRGGIHQVLSSTDGWYLIQVSEFIGWIIASETRYLGRDTQGNGRFDRWGVPSPPEPDMGQYSAPITWTEYRIQDRKLSITFPKLPVARNNGDACAEMDGRTFYAYSGNAVFEFAWYGKSKDSIPKSCNTKTKFSKATYAKRFAELKKEAWGYENSRGTLGELSANVLRSTSSPMIQKLRWLAWDKDHWIEVGITYRPFIDVDVWKVLGGLKRNSTTGREIGIGADPVFGDPSNDAKTNDPGTISIAIVNKFSPGYTEEARKACLQGTVILRATFLKNGAVGNVSVVKGLPMGLTEQAIKAARKIAFLPQIAAGKAVNVTKQIEYSFSIY